MSINKYYVPKLSKIEVQKLRLRAFIGFMDWEKEKLQDLVISFSLKYDTKNASQSDDIGDAVDYKKLTKQIIEMVDNKSFHLIESLADKIYENILDYSPFIQDIFVRVEKPHALRFSDNVLVEISSADRLNRFVVALGSNIDSDNNFSRALEKLQKLGHVVKRTEFIITKPLKYEDQDDFLNGAVLLISSLGLHQLKMELKQIESTLGRVRTDNKNAPRVIDLDVITFNGRVIDEDIEELPFLIDFVNNLEPKAIY